MKKDDIKSFSLRVDEVLLKKFRCVCEYNGRSTNSQLLIYMRSAVTRYEAEHGVIETVIKDEN